MWLKLESRKTKINSVLLALTGIIILLVVTAGIFWYIGSNSEGRILYEAKNSKEVEKITEHSVEAIKEIDTKEILTSNADSNQNDITLTATEERILIQEVAKIDDTGKQELLRSLAEQYSGIMHNQEEEALNMLDQLIAQGKSEWNEIVAKGENTPIVKGEKISEYFAMVNVMEKNMDASMNTVLATMEEQMKAEGIEAKPIIDQYRTDYNNIKEANRGVMFNKAIAALKGV